MAIVVELGVVFTINEVFPVPGAPARLADQKFRDLRLVCRAMTPVVVVNDVRDGEGGAEALVADGELEGLGVVVAVQGGRRRPEGRGAGVGRTHLEEAHAAHVCHIRQATRGVRV